MNNKLSILISIPFFFGCGGSVKKENKNKASASSLSLHVGDEKYVAIDTKQSVVTWKGASLMGSNSHTGYVYLSQGELMIEKGQIVGGTIEVDMNTIEDKDHGRDNNLIKHLKDVDFFEVKKSPFATIAITKVTSLNTEDKEITGNLTIKGITHPVTFTAKIGVKNDIIEANSKLTIDRTKWDVRYKSKKFYDILANQTISDSIEFNIWVITKQYKGSLAQASLLTDQIAKERDAGTIYQSSSPHHNVVHEFTHLVAMQDFCTQTLSQMRTKAKVNQQLAKELEKELLNAKAALTSPKYNGLKIESGLYEKFLEQISDRFPQLPSTTSINKC